MTHCSKIITLLTVVLACQVATAQTVLFSDSFNRVAGTPDVNGSDGGVSAWGTNDNALGGDIVQTWEVGPLPARAGNRHQYVDGDLARFRAGWSEIQHDFAADPRVNMGGGLMIEFDATVADLTNGWLGLAIGQTEAETTDLGTNPNGSGTNDNSSIFLPVEDTIDFGMLFKGQDGTYEIFEGDDFASNNNDAFIPAVSGLDWLAGQDANSEYNFRIEIATTDFGGDGVMATADVYVTTPSPFFENHVVQGYTFDWDDTGEAYIGFSSNKDQGCMPNDDCVDQEVRLNNLTISTLMDVMVGIPGDYNNDGLVSGPDLDLVLQNWGANGEPPPAGWINDLPIGIISAEELDGVLNNWGNTSLASVPEPSAVGPWLFGLAVLNMRRRCCRRR